MPIPPLFGFGNWVCRNSPAIFGRCVFWRILSAISAIATVSPLCSMAKSDASRVVTVEVAPREAHKEGPFVASCDFEVAQIDVLKDGDGNTALRLHAKKEHPSSRRQLLVIIGPRALNAINPDATKAANELTHRRLSVRGKFVPIPTAVLFAPRDGVDFYTARVDVTDIGQLTILEETTSKEKQAHLRVEKDGTAVLEGKSR